MKTISGNPQMIDESILSSVGKGRDNIIQDFLKSAFMSRQYKLFPDMSISLIDENVLLRNRADIPVWIHDCTIVQIVNCGITDFKLPMSAKTVILEDCKNLKNIIGVEGAIIDELIIKDCENVDISTLTNVEIKKVRLYQCGINSLKGLESVLRVLSVKRCKRLRDWDLVNKNNPVIKLENCPIKTFSQPLTSNSVTITKQKKAVYLDVKIGAVEDLRIEDCSDIQELKISGSKLSTLVVDNCESLEKVETVDCTSSASFVNLPKIEEYILPPTITGACVFENVNTVPEVKCKRKIVRK